MCVPAILEVIVMVLFIRKHTGMQVASDKSWTTSFVIYITSERQGAYLYTPYA